MYNTFCRTTFIYGYFSKMFNTIYPWVNVRGWVGDVVIVEFRALGNRKSRKKWTGPSRISGFQVVYCTFGVLTLPVPTLNFLSSRSFGSGPDCSRVAPPWHTPPKTWPLYRQHPVSVFVHPWPFIGTRFVYRQSWLSPSTSAVYTGTGRESFSRGHRLRLCVPDRFRLW